MRRRGFSALHLLSSSYPGGGMQSGNQRQRRANTLRFEQLEPRRVMAVVINEFLALNTGGIQDQDGDRSDWIELRNTDVAAVDVTGWHLTDDAADLDKWTLPAVSIPGGGTMLVYASGKNRSVAGQQLHTNFALAEAGEYLALVMPDGVTVADAFDPYPEQLANVSYGRGASATISENVIGEAAPVRALVPTAGTPATWHTTGFDDASWMAGEGGVGFDSAPDYVPYINMNVGAQMLNVNASIYLRYGFAVANPGDVSTLTLRMRYDDGFAIYINGTAITNPSLRKNAPASLTWNSQATASHNDALAVVYEDLDLTAYRHLLVAGNNVLAIHALNNGASNGDFLISPLLVAARSGPAVVGYMVTPTPGAPNSVGTAGVVADTTFSVDRGFFTNPFTVTIATATPGAEIRYTTDGSVPTATHGSIFNPVSPPLITKTTTLRAAAFKAGFSPTNVDTQTYIFLNNVIQQNGVGLPPFTTWGLNGPDWAMDPDVVNNPAYSGTIKNDLQSLPTVSLVMPWTDWFGGPGQGIYPTASELERAVSMEYFTTDGTNQFQIDAGIEIQGGTSDSRWKMDKLSMRVKFKEPYGPEKLDANIFNGGPQDDNAAVNFNTFILDAHLGFTFAYGGPAGFDQRIRAMYVQDAYVSDLQNLAGGAAPHSQFVHLYINGLYWGMYDMHERADEHFAESYLGGNDEDYDVIKHNPTNVVSADVADPNSAVNNYAAMLALVRQDMSVPASYAAVAAKLDIDDFITYMIVNYYVGNDDWAHQNWYASYNRVDPNGKWRYHSWDAENVLKNVNTNWTGDIDPGAPTEVFHLLMANPEFRLRFNDHVQKYFYNGGLMTPASAAEVYQRRMAEVERAVVAESARWGDNRSGSTDPVGLGNPYLLSHWTTRQADLLANYFPARTGVVAGQFSSRGWITSLSAPVFSKYGGVVASGYQLTIAKPPGSPAAGTLYYTLDGSDPRNSNGGVSPSALPYGGPITINAGVRVRARIVDVNQPGTNNDWSAEIDQQFLLDTPFPLRITELNYNPSNDTFGDPQNLEFIELTNTGAQPISLNGVRITQFSDDGYTFANGLTLAAGERIVVAKNPVAFAAAYGAGVRIAPDGYGSQNLSNGGERIVLLGPLGETLQDFSYDDGGGWPVAADGGGKSLEIIDPLGDATSAANWRSSYYAGGSPGAAGLPPAHAGDFDDDGDVDGGDFLAWQRGLGMPALQAAAPNGDADGDRDVDSADLGLWSSSYGAGAETAVAVMAATLADDEWILADTTVPETRSSRTPRSRAVDAVLAAPGRGAFAPAERAAFDGPFSRIRLRSLGRLAAADRAIEVLFAAGALAESGLPETGDSP